jgi:O-antigen/teichoic acid export membrane protein
VTTPARGGRGPAVREPKSPRGSASLTQVTAHGFAWLFTGSVGQAVLQVVYIAVLARLLSPAEYGAAAAASLVVSLSALVSEVGVGPALVQRRGLRDDEVSAAFWFSVLVSSALAATLFVLAPVLNPLVSLPPESSLLRLMCVTLVLGGVAVVPIGLLQRRMQFRTLATLDFLTYTCGSLGVSVVLAVQGMGAAAVVWGQVANGALTAVVYTVLARPSVRPARAGAAWRSLRPLLGFGSGYSLSQLGNWLARNGDNVVVANVLGPAALGVYSRAYKLLAQPANLVGSAVDKVLFPAMAKIRDDGERLRNAYVRATSLVALVMIPSSVLLFVLAPELVHLLLGDAWSAVVLPLQVFALVLFPRTAYKISGSLTRATGAVYRGAWRQWLYAAEVVVGCVVGSRWGVNGVAVGASVAIVMHFLVMLHFSARVSEGLSAKVLQLSLKYTPVAVAVAAGSYPTAEVLRGTGSDLLTVALTGPAGLLCGAAVLFALRRFFREELSFISTFLAFPRRSRRAVSRQA